MKRLTLLLPLTLLLTFQLDAQEKPDRLKEIGLRMNGRGTYNFMHKVQLKNDVFTRSRLALGFSTDLMQNNYLAIGIAFGSEKRITINEKVDMIQGGELLANLRADFGNGAYTLPAFGIGAVFGLSYEIADNMLLGFEVLPTVLAQYDISERRLSELRFSANTADAALTLMYRF